ncbi:hypothetical protein JCM14036_12470 [Desulfotomaculum defluvii]
MLPCIKESNLGIFSATADQRFLLGEELFLRTHFPVEMKRFRPDGQVTTWSEEALFREIMSDSRVSVGNRTYVLYGAAGSGKSEMIRWLEYHAGKTNRRPYMIRISRTELDPIRILHKILAKFKGIDLDITVYHQWEDLRKKPVTLANHLVWASLGKMLPSDSEIIPLSYQLRPLIEHNLHLNFSGIDNPSEFQERSAELISLEELEDLVRQCAIPLDINCEQLRYLMARELEQSILGGYNFVDTLRSISQELMAKTGIRPLLFIDDLVQSMNLYSTDLLDFFITMEEGNWDTVLGLTPASFETSKRGREILSRITNLDTFDDRLIKLWLTDEQGQSSFFISPENCHIFAEKYISEIKRMGGFVCERCSLVSNCIELQMGMSNKANLSPFNQAFLKRIYKSLPRGKGKARYFILTMGEILQKLALGDIAGALEGYIQREISVDHSNSTVRLIGEAYAPDSVKDDGVISMSGSALSIFFGDEDGQAKCFTASISNLSSLRSQVTQINGDLEGAVTELNTGKAAIRDWLEGREVNKELLKGIRLGIAHICRELSQPCNIISPNTARLSPILKWDESIEGSKIPISFEGIDNFDGVKVPRTLGHTAYSLNYIHLKRGQSKELLLADVLQTSEQLHFILNDAKKLKHKLNSKLENEIGLPISDLSYLLFMVLMELGQGGPEIPASIAKDYQGQAINYPEDLTSKQILLPEEMCLDIRNLFKDWFLLRESIYDAIKLAEMKKTYKDIDPILTIFRIDPSKISHQYKIGELELNLFISNVQSILNDLVRTLREEMPLKEKERVSQLIDLLKVLKHPTEHMEMVSVLSSIAEDIDRPRPDLPDWQECSKLQYKVNRGLKPYLGKKELRVEGPIDMHRFLKMIGQLELDLNFKRLKEVCMFLEDAHLLFKDAQMKLQKEAELLGLTGHLIRNTEWKRQVSLINPKDGDKIKNNLDYALSLSETASRYGMCKRYLQVLARVSPYINYQLYEECSDVLKKLDILLENLREMPYLLQDISVTRGRCEEYCKALDSILFLKNYDTLNGISVSKIEKMYNELTSDLLKMLVTIASKWSTYIKKVSQIAWSLNAKVDRSKEQDLIYHLARIEQYKLSPAIAKGLLEIAEPLLIFCSSIMGNLQSSGIGEQKVLNILLQPVPKELLIIDPRLKDILDFIKKHPELNDLVKVKIYLS